MTGRPLLAVAVLGAGYWSLVAGLTQVSEPWDAESYWALAYPLSILMAAVAGAAFDRRAWLAGPILTMGQLPLLLVQGGGGRMIAFGLLLLVVLAIPAAIVSGCSGWLTRRWCGRLG